MQFGGRELGRDFEILISMYYLLASSPSADGLNCFDYHSVQTRLGNLVTNRSKMESRKVLSKQK